MVDLTGVLIRGTKNNREVLITPNDLNPVTTSGTILASQTLVIDSHDISTWNSSDYILTLIAGTKRRQYNISAVNDEGTPVDKVSKIGSNISANIDSTLNGTTFEFNVTNNEAVDIDYILTKIIH